jgi:hypothetical protein
MGLTMTMRGTLLAILLENEPHEPISFLSAAFNQIGQT